MEAMGETIILFKHRNIDHIAHKNILISCKDPFSLIEYKQVLLYGIQRRHFWLNKMCFIEKIFNFYWRVILHWILIFEAVYNIHQQLKPAAPPLSLYPYPHPSTAITHPVFTPLSHPAKQGSWNVPSWPHIDNHPHWLVYLLPAALTCPKGSRQAQYTLLANLMMNVEGCQKCGSQDHPWGALCTVQVPILSIAPLLSLRQIPSSHPYGICPWPMTRVIKR